MEGRFSSNMYFAALCKPMMRERSRLRARLRAYVPQCLVSGGKRGALRVDSSRLTSLCHDYACIVPCEEVLRARLRAR